VNGTVSPAAPQADDTAPDATPRVGIPPEPGRDARLCACTILLVDDEPANLDLLEALLEGEGYGAAGGGCLVRTSDSREVLALADAHAPDLVLLDLHMPHRHGLDVLADLRAATPPGDYRPVLVLTADVTSEAKARALSLGARDFVTKPFDAVEVLLRVENLLEARVLHAAERRARERAEAAEARASLLAEWSRRLGATLAPTTAAAQLPELVVPRWAAACQVVLDDVVVGNEPDDALAPRVVAPVMTEDGAVGQVMLAGVGSGPGAGLATDQALADELAARLGMAAEHARLLAAAELATGERERLLAVVAHDLRNPLGAVAMYAEMLASLQSDDPAADSPAESYTRGALATIHASTQAMQHLVEDLLDASSLRGGALRVRRSAGPAGAPFAEAERMLRPMAERAGIALDVGGEGDAADRTVRVDGARVVQLLSNLVGNAITHTPPGGRVTVRYAVEASDRAAEGDGALRLSVADTGPGIAPDDLPHLFTAFWRGDRRDRRGVGLGLWIARAIVEAHGGELDVASRPGAGTTFTCTLPPADAPGRRPED
jgi:signal transduction histidine kinase/DNA-binding response OmpR family regulator